MLKIQLLETEGKTLAIYVDKGMKQEDRHIKWQCDDKQGVLSDQ